MLKVTGAAVLPGGSALVCIDCDALEAFHGDFAAVPGSKHDPGRMGADGFFTSYVKERFPTRKAKGQRKRGSSPERDRINVHSALHGGPVSTIAFVDTPCARDGASPEVVCHTWDSRHAHATLRAVLEAAHS